MIYRLAELLLEVGIDARIIADISNEIFFSTSIPANQAAEIAQVQSGDIVIFPETNMKYLSLFGFDIRKWIYCQNQYYIFNQIDEYPDWEKLGVERVICSSISILDFVARFQPRMPRYYIPCRIEHELFHYNDSKASQIAFLPRKRVREAKFIRGAFAHLYPQFDSIPWIPIENVNLEETAAILRRSRWFLSLSFLEGLGLPPLEAMACGCIVAGFHGGGGKEYASAANGIWCDEGDLEAAVHSLARAVEMVEIHPDIADIMTQHALHTASLYNRDASRRKVMRCFDI